MEDNKLRYMENLRKMRGYAIIAKGDTPKMVNEETFIVPSQSNPDKKYEITYHEGWSCTCPDFQKRHIKCKHIRAVELWLNLRKRLEDDDLFNEFESEIKCPYCGSYHVMKNGTRKNKNGVKQRYMCKDCNRTFVLDPAKGHKANGKLIALSMDLYFKGLSFRKIADTIYQFYGVKIHHDTIRRWINKFMDKINKHVNKIEPNVGDVWHIDEQQIKINGEWYYSWNVLDENRFLIANIITKGRSVFETEMVLKKALKNAHGIKPKIIITDGMRAYPTAIKNVFGSNVTHIGNVGLRSRINNNIIERYHGTYRERDKVMRGLESVKTARQMNENMRTYYNFIREHQTLKHTPAEEAGINLVTHRNRWITLLQKSNTK